MTITKLCPLQDGECKGERCAWWVEAVMVQVTRNTHHILKDTCALVVAARNGSSVSIPDILAANPIHIHASVPEPEAPDA